MAATEEATSAKYGAGTELQIALAWDGTTPLSDLASGDFQLMKGYNELPQVGDEVEEEEDTELWQLAREYTSDKLETPSDFELTYKSVPGDAVRAGVTERAQERGLLAMRVVYSTGDRRTFAVRFLGDYIDSTSVDDRVMVMVKGKINGAMIKDTVAADAPVSNP